MKRKEQVVSFYNLILGILAIVSLLSYIALIFFELGNDAVNTVNNINIIIYFMFLFEYLYGLFKSEEKKEYFKSNIFDLIAIIPFSNMFRIFKLIRIVRAVKIIRKNYSKTSDFFRKSKFQNMIYINIAVAIVGTMLISIIEKKTFVNSLWFTVVTITTVGYGDVTVNTMAARVIAFLLMLVGIGSVSYITSRIASYLLEPNIKKIGVKEQVAFDICEKLKDYKKLKDEEIDDMCKILKSLNK